MTVPAGITNRTTLTAATPNLQFGQIADPSRRLAMFEYLFDIVDANWNAFVSNTAGSSGAEKAGSAPIAGVGGTNVFAQLVAIKGLIDSLDLNKAVRADVYTKLELLSTAVGNSGADNIKASPITGVTGETIQEILQDIKYQLNSAVTGDIPPGSITQEMLAFEIASDDTTITVTDANNHFTAAKLNGVLDELFTSASSVKTNVANAIGAPATSSDTGTVLANRITTEKGKLAAEIGDGNSTSTLQYLADRLVVRSNAIATAVNTKGVPATSADTLAQLATKVGQIVTGKRWASGVIPTAVTQGVYKMLQVTGMSFSPKTVIVNSSPTGQGELTIYSIDPTINFGLSIVRVKTGIAWSDGRTARPTTDPFTGMFSDGFKFEIETGKQTEFETGTNFRWIAFD